MTFALIVLGAVETVSGRSEEFRLVIPKGGALMMPIIIVLLVVAVGVWGFVIFKTRRNTSVVSDGRITSEPSPREVEEVVAAPEEVAPVEPTKAPAVAVAGAGGGTSSLPFPFISIIGLLWLMSLFRRRR